MLEAKQMQKHSNTYYTEGIASGDDKVLLEIYNDFLPMVKRFVKKEAGGASDAEDVFNQVLMQLYARMKVKHFEIESTFEGYLFTACKNIWRREFNKKIKTRVTNESYVEHMDRTEDGARAILEQEKWELFQDRFEQLSENCKKILQLHLEKVSGKEIMKRLDYASESTVRQRIFKCKSSLVKQIRNDKRYRA
jgi:RNA polymerase sigma factor (sigma-70 family)